MLTAGGEVAGIRPLLAALSAGAYRTAAQVACAVATDVLAETSGRWELRTDADGRQAAVFVPEDAELCEGCNAVATGMDVEGVPLCAECLAEVETEEAGSAGPTPAEN